jgi:hypothetical protein
MDSTNSKPPIEVLPAANATPASDAYRTKSVATRLTEAEVSEVEVAAARAGKKVSEWLREAALVQARAAQEVQTDTILLAEIMGMRSLMMNLFAKASEGPLSVEDLRKMAAYSDSMKEQRAVDLMAQRRRRKSLDQEEKEKPKAP